MHTKSLQGGRFYEMCDESMNISSHDQYSLSYRSVLKDKESKHVAKMRGNLEETMNSIQMLGP